MAKFNQTVSETSAYLTEQDLLKYVAEMFFSRYRGTTVNFYNIKEQNSLEQNIKLCNRIWSGYTKFIRSQCNKDRIVDSLYFGHFVKLDDD
jgi:hypothetical protein